MITPGSYFPITSICEEDLISRGFDTSNVDDATMEKLASKMANDYLEQMFWISLDILAEAIGIPRLPKKNMVRLAVIDHDEHKLFVEDVDEKTLKEYENECAYVRNNYAIAGSFSCSIIKEAEYIPEGDPHPVEIDFKELVN